VIRRVVADVGKRAVQGDQGQRVDAALGNQCGIVLHRADRALEPLARQIRATVGLIGVFGEIAIAVDLAEIGDQIVFRFKMRRLAHG